MTEKEEKDKIDTSEFEPEESELRKKFRLDTFEVDV